MATRLLTIFAAVLAVTSSYPKVKTWTLNELSHIVGSGQEDPKMKPYYTTAINTIMFSLFTGVNGDTVTVCALSPSGNRKWTMEELNRGSKDPALNITLQPYIYASISYLLQSKEKEVEVLAPAQDISTWNVTDILEAIEDPDTNPALIPYLEKAKREITDSVKNGKVKNKITMVTPVGLIPVKNGKTRFLQKIAQR